MLSQRIKNHSLLLCRNRGVNYIGKKLFRLILILFALFVFYNIPKKYLGDTYPICLSQIILKQKCPGCGTTRAIWSALHLNINDAIEYNGYIVVILPLMIGCTISWIIKRV
jgi:hypothetical protein